MPNRVPRASVPLVLAILATLPSAQAGVDPKDLIFENGFEISAPNCAPVQSTIGSEGGVLELCGAKLEVPANTVAQPVTFGIERLDDPPPPPFDMSFVGPVFRFTPTDAPLQGPVSITVPRNDTARGGLVRFEPEFDAFILIEACGATDTSLQQFQYALNTFAAARYVGDLPDNTTGLGDGTATGTVDGGARSYDVDEPGNYAIYEDREDGSRLVTVSVLTSPSEGDFESLRMNLVVDAANATGEVIQVEFLSSIGGNFVGGSYMVGIMGTASITFGDLGDGRVRANVDANLARSGGGDLPLQMALDVGVERFIFPPSLSCPRPD
ncbi:hypothetical protein [Dokdonella sp.]|uniref:hypothetical protein n=1 Tax=Dokdonella sp. TaxID=2291710 RepID=UPI001AFE19A9|nr:hypothetical protein [Dokdonella sp.]MBO9662542.1 hypothetical protein [Dokdonella sp.]